MSAPPASSRARWRGSPGGAAPAWRRGPVCVEAGQLRLAVGGGRPLPDWVRAKMEAAFGVDFADVRVHVGLQAERIVAIAFTIGSDIQLKARVGDALPRTTR